MGEKADDLIDLDRLVVEELSGPNADRLARVRKLGRQREAETIGIAAPAQPVRRKFRRRRDACVFRRHRLVSLGRLLD